MRLIFKNQNRYNMGKKLLEMFENFMKYKIYKIFHEIFHY